MKTQHVPGYIGAVEESGTIERGFDDDKFLGGEIDGSDMNSDWYNSHV